MVLVQQNTNLFLVYKTINKFCLSSLASIVTISLKEFVEPLVGFEPTTWTLARGTLYPLSYRGRPNELP